jgi:hypothetical protein
MPAKARSAAWAFGSSAAAQVTPHQANRRRIVPRAAVGVECGFEKGLRRRLPIRDRLRLSVSDQF